MGSHFKGLLNQNFEQIPILVAKMLRPNIERYFLNQRGLTICFDQIDLVSYYFP